MDGPLNRAERYRKVAAQYLGFAKTAPSPFLRSYYQCTGEKYRLQAEGELGKRPRGRSHSGGSSFAVRTFATASLDHPPSIRQ
jgi:hypothetical protein